MFDDTDRAQIMERLDQIAEAHGGRLTPNDVVSDAKDPSSPLHAHFEWDTAKASAAYWIEQARTLITSVRIKVTSNDPETRTVRVTNWVRDPSAEEHVQGYISIPRLRTQAEMAREAVVAEFTQVAHALRRARELAIALGSAEEVDALLHSVIGLRQRFMDAPRASQ